MDNAIPKHPKKVGHTGLWVSHQEWGELQTRIQELEEEVGVLAGINKENWRLRKALEEMIKKTNEIGDYAIDNDLVIAEMNQIATEAHKSTKRGH